MWKNVKNIYKKSNILYFSSGIGCYRLEQLVTYNVIEIVHVVVTHEGCLEVLPTEFKE